MDRPVIHFENRLTERCCKTVIAQAAAAVAAALLMVLLCHSSCWASVGEVEG